MKKVISSIIAVILCVSMIGCVSDEEKFLKKQDEWFANLSYDYFQLHRVDDVDGYNLDYGHGIASIIYNFYIKVPKAVDRKTIRFDYISDEAIDLITDSGDNPIMANGKLFLSVAFGEEFLPADKVPQNIPFTLSYTTTDGEEVSKDYVLDFTQTPFWDYRTGTGLYQP